MSYTVWTVRPGTSEDVIVASNLPSELDADRVVVKLREIYQDTSAYAERD